jgi:hypothetical protein
MPKGEVNKAKTHCPKGHEYSEENTMRRDGKRHCLTCVRLRARDYMRRIRAIERSPKV